MKLQLQFTLEVTIESAEAKKDMALRGAVTPAQILQVLKEELGNEMTYTNDFGDGMKLLSMDLLKAEE